MTDQALYERVRYSPRFEPDAGDRATICLDPRAERFRPNIVAEIIDESFDGCGLVMYPTNSMQVGDQCLAQIGRLSPMPATVVWRRVEEQMAVRVGLRYGH